MSDEPTDVAAAQSVGLECRRSCARTIPVWADCPNCGRMFPALVATLSPWPTFTVDDCALCRGRRLMAQGVPKGALTRAQKAVEDDGSRPAIQPEHVVQPGLWDTPGV